MSTNINTRIKDQHTINGIDYVLFKKFHTQEAGLNIPYIECESHYVSIEGVIIEFDCEEMASEAYYGFIDCLPEDQ